MHDQAYYDICVVNNNTVKCNVNEAKYIRDGILVLEKLSSYNILFMVSATDNIICPGKDFQELVWGKDKGFLWSFPDFLQGKKIYCVRTKAYMKKFDDNLYVLENNTSSKELDVLHNISYYSLVIKSLIGHNACIFFIPFLEPKYSMLTILSGRTSKPLSYATQNFLRLFISDTDIVQKLADLITDGLLSHHIIISIIKGIIGYSKINVFTSDNKLFVETKRFDLTYKKLGKGREIIIHDH